MTLQSVTVLGATGSIGCSTLDILARHPERFRLEGVTAYSSWRELAAICIRHAPRVAVLVDEDGLLPLRESLQRSGCKTEVLGGRTALLDLAADAASDTVVAGIVGAAGLEPALRAVQAGKRLLLANKEALVVAGKLFMDAVRNASACLLPVDSEHNAIFQCLPERLQHVIAAPGKQPTEKLESGPVATGREEIRRILLTASGGPFLKFDHDQLRAVTPDQACRHPQWEMGRKISVDSATLMNKGLELIEACWLFSLPVEAIEVHIHPQSIIHSMVEFLDGSILAQMGAADMRTPIAHALGWPRRLVSGSAALNFFELQSLTFERPDRIRFPCLRLAEESFAAGGVQPAVLNAANEIAVAAFLDGKLGFQQIPELIEDTLEREPAIGLRVDNLDDLLQADQLARDCARRGVTRVNRVGRLAGAEH